MKFISGFFQVIAYILVFIVILTLPITLLGRNAASIVYDRETMYDLASQHLLNAEFIAVAGREVVQQALLDGTAPTDPVSTLFVNGLANLSQEEWVQLIEQIAPQDLVKATLTNTVNGYYDWLEGSETVPAVHLDMTGWKRNLTANAIPVAETVLNALDQCTPQEVDEYSLIISTGEGDKSSSIPICRPPEPLYSRILELGASTLPGQLAAIPDTLEFGSNLNAQQLQDLADLKVVLRQTRLMLGGFWVIVLAMFLVAIPMGARSADSLFRWFGWPLILSGAFTFLLGLIVGGLANGLINNVTQNLPEAVAGPTQATALALFTQVVRPTISQGIIQGLLGGISVLIAYFIKRSSKDDEFEYVVDPQASTVQGGMPQVVAQPAVPEPSTMQAKTPEEGEMEGDGEEDDDSKPTGMFG